ncbi:hypothetical protein PTTG_29440 [Puccinia triticina 1-1 BBBD Race 1]|uniref:Helicase ATP-binding domain-containing protein n=1 Tax=Puccinia triticina (isolate 1-1 / race 1 (BBBD)) TaxID=630390 RepID=A0A180G4Q8_PUCT1|nr:hypothetical protein PTTG_29440 [Puccinia triticina 1-1 BBBD Race 1]
MPSLTLILILFSPSDHSAEVLRILEESNLETEKVEGYCPEKCHGIPHSSRIGIQQRLAAAASISGCKTPLLPHQQRALEFILQLESPESNILSAFWNSPTCEWLKYCLNKLADSGQTRADINHQNQGSILADDMGLGKTLTSLALIARTKNDAAFFASKDTRNAKATLVICPLSTLTNWEAEILKHLNTSLITYAVYHGEERKKWSGQEIWANDIVLVTYDTVANHHESRCEVLFGVTWFCTILDEAHLIRDPSTKRSRAILALESQRKLCLTGTPLQNHLSDLYTLLRFVRVDPWAREEVWQLFIKPNIRRKSVKAINLLQQLLTTVSLRRLKTEVLQLPPKVEEQVAVQLVEPWREDYRNRYYEFAEMFGVERESETWDAAEFFQQLTMLRLYCDHPGLVDMSKWSLPKTETTWSDSPKIVHLITDLKKHLTLEQGGKVAKAVVFSQWTNYLQIVGVALAEAGIHFEQLNGGCSLQQRGRSLETLRQDPNVRVLLATVGAGGVGIDLTCTQKVYLMEPCWNPSVESQATDRAYRLGQQCTTHIIRYFVEGSIEVNIMEVRLIILQIVNVNSADDKRRM